MTTPNLAATSIVLPKILYSGLLATGTTSLYSPAASKAAKLSKLVLCNISGGAVVLSVSFFKSGVSPDNNHKIIHNFTLGMADTLTVEEVENMYLGDGDQVSVNVNTASAIVATLNGLEFS